MKIVEALRERKILVADGAWGTQFVSMGMQPGECPDFWSCSNYEKVVSVAESYILAGADLVETNSFGANRIKLAAYGLEARDVEINKLAASATREAALRCEKEIVVAGSMGPCGKLLLMEEVEEEELYDAFAAQAIALEAGGADAACIETMMDLEEAKLAIRAVKENTNLEIISLFTFGNAGKGGYRTMMGVSPEQAAREAVACGASVVGSNCGYGMEHMADILAAMQGAVTNTVFMVNANAGLPKQTPHGTVYPETPSQTASFVPRLLDQGVTVLGGCCGTTPEHIQAIRQAVNSWLSSKI